MSFSSQLLWLFQLKYMKEICPHKNMQLEKGRLGTSLTSSG